MKRIILSVLVISVIFGFSGCGNSSSDDVTSPQSGGVSTKNGIFVDTIVQGIEYTTETQSGVTDANGSFSYKDGETVTFKIGGINLGTTKASEIVTPLNIIGTTSSQSINVVNMLILLQSLDEDKNTSNGIKISSVTLDSSKSMSVDFSQKSPIDISSTLTQIGLSSDEIISEIDAKKHFTNSILSTYSSANDTLTTSYLNGKTFYTKNFVDDNGDYYYRYSIITYTNNYGSVKEYNDYDGKRTWDAMGENYTISNNSIISNHSSAKLVKIQDDKLILLESYGYPESWGAQVEEFWTTKPSGFPSE